MLFQKSLSLTHTDTDSLSVWDFVCKDKHRLYVVYVLYFRQIRAVSRLWIAATIFDFAGSFISPSSLVCSLLGSLGCVIAGTIFLIYHSFTSMNLFINSKPTSSRLMQVFCHSVFRPSFPTPSPAHCF